MFEDGKTVKEYAKEAKKRLKNGFWQDYRRSLNRELDRAKEIGISESKIKDFYSARIIDDIKSTKKSRDEFYLKVKKILDEEGEISDAIGRLTDKDEYESLSYEEKQRYTLSLSEEYLKAVERYKKERAVLTPV